MTRVRSKSVLLLAVLVFFPARSVVAIGHDAQTQDPLTTPVPHKKQPPPPNPPADRIKATLPAFSLEVKADETTAEIGKKLKVEVTLTNTSQEDIFYEAYNRPFGLEVRDETGKFVAKTPDGLTADLVGGSSPAFTLHPGESIHRFVRLDKEFKLDKPGNYFVQAARGTSDENRRNSNTITITIIP